MIMDSSKTQSNCNHNMVKWRGFWDGKDLYLSWTEWNQIPEQNREESDKIKKMENTMRARPNKASSN